METCYLTGTPELRLDLTKKSSLGRLGQAIRGKVSKGEVRRFAKVFSNFRDIRLVDMARRGNIVFPGVAGVGFQAELRWEDACFWFGDRGVRIS